MTLQVEHVGPKRGVRVTGIVLVLVGAVVMGASAASAKFDLGEDLELGQAVHDVDGGPAVAWAAAALLLAVAGLAVVSTTRAARVLTWLGIGAAVGTVIIVGVASLVDGSIVGLGAVPFVLAFFSGPALLTSLFLKAPAASA